MPRTSTYEHDDDGDEEQGQFGDGPGEHEDPDESDQDDDEGNEFVETNPCPHCRRPIYEQAEICPHCGSYVSREDAPARRPPMWIILGVIITVAVVLLAWVFGGL